MSGFVTDDFRHDCEVAGCYMKVHAPVWEWMRGCFPRDIMPTDIDGMVEVDGRVLFIEQKGAGVPVHGGQGPALRQLATLPGVTVLLIRPAGDIFEKLVYDGTKPQGWKRCTLAQLQAWLSAWASAADTAA